MSASTILIRLMATSPVYCLTVLAILVSAGGSACIAQQFSNTTEQMPHNQPANSATAEIADRDRFEQLRLFAEALDQIERKYVTEVDRRELVEAAIDGMLSKLDPFSDYIPPDEISRFRGAVESEFAGIGIHVSIEDGFLQVISPVHGSPAYEGGVLAGDKVVKINNLDAEGITMDDAVKLIQGKVGTTVRITVRHRAGDALEEIELKRANIKVPTVLGDQLNADDTWDWFYRDPQLPAEQAAKEKIGYIRLTSFSRRSVLELVPALEALKAEGVQGLILDLRYNPGGLLPVAIQISDLFVEEGAIVSTKGRSQRDRQWEARRDDMFPQIPMAVLVNEYSASASEILAACLKDNDRAVIVGKRTFGKGSVQNVIDLEDGKSILKLTTAAYFRPNGRNIHREKDATEEDEWGVHPSDGFKVEMDDQQAAAYLEHRRQRDALGQNTKTDNAQQKKSDDSSAEPFRDLQLEKAVQYIRSKTE